MADPRQAEDFRMNGWQASASESAVTFSYTCSRYGDFEEVVRFPTLQGGLFRCIDQGLADLLTLLQIALGVSYYKCAAAKVIIMSPSAFVEETLEYADVLYRYGLAEFYVRSGMFKTAELTFGYSPEQNEDAYPEHLDQSTVLNNTALVAWGGGKDSYVADAIARKADVKSQRISAVMSDKVRTAIQRTSAEPVLFMERKLDPKLREVNAAGALNGHVPITAINSLMLVILGRLTGAKYAIFANERSADEPTIQQDGITANHQYSKSSEFEGYLRDAIAAADPGAPDYFSILRPFSEIWIAEKFSKLNNAFPAFTSCNRNFQITGDTPPRWCGDCAKCAFTSLMLAPHLSPIKNSEIFPASFLDLENLLPMYRELCGLTEKKPWDCVGTINECRATFYQLSKSRDWRESLAVRTLLPEILALHSEKELEVFWADGLTTAEKHFIPAPFLDAAHAL